MPEDDIAKRNQSHNEKVYARGPESTILLVVVEAPNVLNGLRLRFKLERWKLLREEELVDLPEEMLIKRLLLICDKQMQFRFLTGETRIHCLGSHIPRYRLSLLLGVKFSLTTLEPAL